MKEKLTVTVEAELEDLDLCNKIYQSGKTVEEVVKDNINVLINATPGKITKVVSVTGM